MLVRRACNLCEAICGLRIEIENNTVKSIAGDPDDPLSRGYLCPKAFALKEIYEDPNRLKTPLKRTAAGWKSIGWEEALDETAERLLDIKKRYGANAVGVYLGNPNVHNLGALLNLPGFIRSVRSQNTFSATSADQLPHHVASWLMFGHPMLLPVPDITRTHCMLILGGNPLASNGSMMTAPGVANHLKSIRQRGGKVIVVDPRRTETAEHADEHLFIRPSTDVFLLLALLQVLFAEKRVALQKRREKTLPVAGLEALAPAVQPFTPEKAAVYTNIAPERIRQLARTLSDAPSAVVYGRMGLSVQRYGGLCQWLIQCLNIVTGNFDAPGGAMFTTPAADILLGAKPRNIMGRWHSRVRGLPEIMGELPVSVMAEEMLTPGEGQIKAFVTSAGNPVLSTPNGTQLEKALGQMEFVVSMDIYLNETTRHAHIILPPATGLEVAHYDLTFNVLSVRNTAKYSAPTLPKAPEARYDYEILQGLTHRLMETEGAFEPVPPEVPLDTALQLGPHHLTLAQLQERPEGLDLGELQPCLPERLVHENKTIQVAPDLYLSALKNLAESLNEDSILAKAPEFPLTLIGRRHLRDNNSWMHNAPKLMKGRTRCTLLIHPDDAAHYGIDTGQEVLVTSRTNQVRVPAEITDDIMPGVVSMPHGYGHHRPGVQLDTATQFAGVSINDLTDDLEVDTLTGNAAFSNVGVRIAAVV
jgi:anaerobic selenocysteine-containing dehydrogenase